VADGYAKDGFLAIAPALFDRVQPDVELKYEGEDLKTGMGIVQKLVLDQSLSDIAAASDFVCSSTGKKVGIVGYCYGGTMAWLAAARLHPEAAVGYYGGQIAKHIDEEPAVPVMLHFGKQDNHIPAADVEKIQAAHPEVEIYWYDAGHGFNCDARASYNPASAQEARARSLVFLKKHLT
jgi:carboxymethylenebutenolidase